jgi:hypothetical protein
MKRSLHFNQKPRLKYTVPSPTFICMLFQTWRNMKTTNICQTKTARRQEASIPRSDWLLVHRRGLGCIQIMRLYKMDSCSVAIHLIEPDVELFASLSFDLHETSVQNGSLALLLQSSKLCEVSQEGRKLQKWRDRMEHDNIPRGKHWYCTSAWLSVVLQNVYQ